MLRKLALSFFVTGSLFVTGAVSIAFADSSHKCGDQRGYERFAISGTAIHYFDTKIVHRSHETAGGLRETTTETIDLTGDLEGRVLYQPTGNYDFVNGKLVNTGKQVFSGTVLGSEPVVIFDDEFRFEVDLNTGVVQGKVYLSNSIAGPKTECELEVSGRAQPGASSSRATYTGYCRVKKVR